MIKTSAVFKSFGPNRVLRGVDIEIPEGQTRTIIGGSGCGKSVLLKNMTGLLKPESGEIFVDGREITRLGEAELLEATGPESPVAKYIEKKGQGVHHIAFRVENIEAALAELKEKGVALIDETPRKGAGGGKIAFIHPKATGGVLVELCERSG